MLIAGISNIMLLSYPRQDFVQVIVL